MRAGVFLCQCGGNISDVLDVQALAAGARGLSGVAEVAVLQFLCGTEGRGVIERALESRGLDHLVIGACSPRFQGPTFERIARDLKLGENAVAFANLREGCSFIHRHAPQAAQDKARRILAAAVARAARQCDLPRTRTFVSRSALVVGGGIAGMSASEELAAAGIEVHLVEREAALGGYMARLSKTFPTEDCAMCSLAPRLTAIALDPRIHVHTLTDVAGISGPPGEFRVTLRHRPRYVTEACVACGQCAAACPVTVPSDFDFGVATRAAIGRPFANAVPPIFAIDPLACRRCQACQRACPAHAVDLEMQETIEDISVGAVVVATGHKEFDARRKIPLGYGRFENVLTQSQVARLLAASGPTGGELRRPSDGAVPRSVFMLQCTGSRDCTASGNEHCSAICCLFSTLHASLIRQHHPGTEITIGYTDMRTPGKSHEEYYRLVQTRGVNYVRGRVSEIAEEPDRRLRVRFEDTVTGRKNEELFDLVVLSAGLEASDGTAEIARIAGLQTTGAGFIKEYHPKLRPVDTHRPGLFVCGTAQGPKSIPDSIAQAKAAASRVLAMLSTGYVLTPAQVASCNENLCIGCGVCQSVCPHEAVTRSSHAPERAVVNPNACRGCGICAADCPTGAIQLGGFSDEEIMAEVCA
ncbi:MAG: CoB--CoM heterodisulfide reductase iron-sulfur subunit A family protein [Thermoguttaceae bacterium]|jgi:heterodisulfide reductase subunit A